MGIDHFIGSTSPKLCVATVSANRSKHIDQEIALPKRHAKCMGRKLLTQQPPGVDIPPGLLKPYHYHTRVT